MWIILLTVLRFQVAIEAGGAISRADAIALGSVNLEKLLGGDTRNGDADLVAWRGGDMFEAGSKAVAVVSPRLKLVHIF